MISGVFVGSSSATYGLKFESLPVEVEECPGEQTSGSIYGIFWDFVQICCP